MTAILKTTRIRRKQYSIIAFILFIALFFPPINRATAVGAIPNILVLNSYHQGEDWSDNEIKGIRIKLNEAYPFLVPSIEDLDTKRFPNTDHLLTEKQYLKRKYRDKDIDLIISLDNSALNLMLEFGDDLFPGVPIVFAGVNGYSADMLAGHRNTTGVAEVEDVQGTLNLALKINPGIKTVFAVHDYTSSGFAVYKDMESIAEKFKSKVTIKYSSDGTVDDLMSQLRALHQDAIVILLTYVTDKNGKTFTREESTRLITSASPVPVYAMHETRLGYGILGGMLIKGEEHGKQAADIALRVLSGEKPDTIQVVNSRSLPVFDYNQIEHFKIPIKRLPANSVIINLPLTFWDKYQPVLLPGSIILGLLTVTIFILSFSIMRVRKAEGAARESEEKYRLIVQNQNDLVVKFDSNQRIVYASPSYCRTFGKSENELLGSDFKPLIHTKDIPTVQASLATLTEEPHMTNHEERAKTVDGWKWFSWSAKAIVNSDGKIQEVLSVGRDITERKQAEANLHENEIRYRGLFENAQDAIFVANPETGTLMDVNPAAEKLTGYSKKELVGKPQTFIHPSGDDDFYQAEFQKATLQSGTKFNEMLIQAKGGKTIPVEISSGGTFRAGNEKLHIGFFRDITERKMAEEKILATTEMLSLATRAARLGIWDWDIKNNELVWDDGMYPLYGIRKDEFASVYEAWLNGLHPEDRLENDKLSEQARRGEREYDTEFRVVWPDGTIKYLKALGQVMWDSDGNPIRMTGINYDITEKKEMEVRIQQSQKMEAIGNLAGGIAHDFNNLLFPIVGMSELLMEDLPRNSQEYENAQEILKAGKRGGDLVRQILAFSRQSEHKLIPVRAQQILKEVLRLIRATIPSYIELDEDIQSDCGLLMADPTQIHQVAMNIITNAFHAVESKGGKIIVRLREIALGTDELKNSLLGGGRYVILTVTDTGEGISPNLMDKIFEPYFTTKEQGKGTGLGLAVAHGIIKEHNGDIKVHSEIGKGTSIDIYLPVMRKTDGIETNEQAKDDPKGNEHILLVDDEESIAQLERQMLERLDYTVSSRINSVEALEAFKAKPDAFDLVITDMTMPNMTGDQLAQELMSIQPDIPVIICTGFSERINKEQAEANKVKGFLMKPVVKSELAQMVRKVLDEAKFHKGN